MSVKPPSFGPSGSPFVQILQGGELFKPFARSINFEGVALSVDALSQGVTVPAPGSTVSLISRTVGAAVANVDIVLPSAPLIKIVSFFRPVNDGVLLRTQFAVGGAVQTGANDYLWATDRFTIAPGTSITGSGVVGANNMTITDFVGNAADEGTSPILQITNPASATEHAGYTSTGITYQNDGNPSRFDGYGLFNLNTNAIDGIRFFFSAGNIADFEINVYAFANA